MSGEEDLQLTYDLQSFIELKAFFDRRSSFYRKTNSEYNLIIDNLPESVRSFLLMDNFWYELDDLNQNCATVRAFENRFFQKFNAFKILKYLNFTTEHFYPKNELVKQAEKLHQMFSV